MSDLSELRHTKSVLEREHASIVGAIHELRARARKASIEASSTRTPLPETEIQFWKTNIARCQAELMATQSKLGEVNQAIRAAHANQPIKTLGQLPREVAPGKPETHPDRGRDGVVKPGRVLFLEFFHQLCTENLHPKQFAVLEADAHSLVDAHLKTHVKEDRP